VAALAEMPTILRTGPYRVYFFSSDGREPPHVHVDRDDRMVKFWLAPLRCDQNHGFPAIELRKIEGILKAHQPRLVGAWYDYFRR